MLNYFDTSALLATNNIETLFGLHDTCYVAHNVIGELENIKNSASKSDEIKMRARRVARFLISHPLDYMCSNFPEKEIEKMRKKFCFPDNTDGRILAEAVCLARKNIVKLFTGDVNMFLFARECGELEVEFVGDNGEEEEQPWAGWSKYYPDEQQLSMLYSSPTINTLNAATNEYCLIHQGKELVDILRWTGSKYTPLKYSNFRNSFLGKSIKPLNLQQKLAFDLLQNQNITVKVLTGVPGGGKDYVQFLHALDLVSKGLFDKIIYIRNLIPFKDAPEIGFLAGSLEEKISWGLGPIRSILGEEGLNMLEEQGIIENTNLAFIRGASFSRSIIYISEGANLTASGYKLIVSRCGEESQVWINGDYKQTDLDKFKRDNGLVRLTNSLKGNELFGTVKFTETERSATAELAAII